MKHDGPESIKKSIWMIPTRGIMHYKVAYEEPVSEEEAMEIFVCGEDFYVIDEEFSKEEVLDWAE